MKKILALIIAVLMISLCFVGCNNTNGNNNATSAPEGDATTAPVEGDATTAPVEGDATTAPVEGDATTAPEGSEDSNNPTTNGVLKMATNAYFKPYEYYEGDQIIGIDAEIAKAIANYLGYELVIEDMEFDSIITAVKGGFVDFGMAGMTITEDRLLEVDFSISYATGVQSIIVPAGSPIKSVDDLYAEGANYNIGVQEATTGDLYATWDLEDAGLATVHRYNKGADAVQALVTGKLDCVIIDNEPAKAFVAQNNK